MDTLPFKLVEKVIKREWSRRREDEMPNISFALSFLDKNHDWVIKDTDNQIVCFVKGERVDFEET